MDAPAVTVITPTYNHEAYIGACIRSVQAQTRPDWEMLVVDDGSTDGTAAVVQTLADEDGRIRLLRQDNVGVYRLQETYNRALAEARGAFVAVLEGDDLWLPEKLARQLPLMEADPRRVLAWSDAFRFNDHVGDLRRAVLSGGRCSNVHYRNEPVGAVLNQLYLHNCVVTATVIVRVDALREIDGFQQPYGLPLVDLPTWLTLATRGPFVFVPEPLARWRQHPSQVTQQRIVEIVEGCCQLVLDHFGALPAAVRPVVALTERDLLDAAGFKRHRALTKTGRQRLQQRRFGEARRAYAEALLYGGPLHPRLRLRAAAGLLGSLLRRDLAGLARRRGRRSYT